MGGKAVVSHLKKEVKERGASAGRVRIGQVGSVLNTASPHSIVL